MNKALKLVSTEMFSARLEISGTFRDIMSAIKVCIVQVQKFKYLIR